MKSIVLALMMLVLGSAVAWAVNAPPVAPAVVTPSNKQVPLPAFADPSKAQAQAQTAPPLVLPPANPCRPPDVPGLWRLQSVYEFPAGKEIEAYRANPLQYMYFEDNNVFGRYNAPGNNMKTDEIRDQIIKHAAGLQQYLIPDKQFLYFYQDKVAVDTQACFIVAETRNGFAAGQMILMPPKGTIPGRLVKWYNRIWAPAPQVQPPQLQQVVQPQPNPPVLNR